MAFLSLLSFVGASPVLQGSHAVRDDADRVRLEEKPAHRVAAVVLCIVYAFLLALAQGYRAGRMAGKKSRNGLSDILVFLQGFVSIAFVFAVGIDTAGLGLTTDAQCYGAIRICISLYGAAKIALYLFLLERVHIVRAPFVDRVRDPIYIVGAISTICGFAAIMAYQFVAPMAELSREDGICRIGIQSGAAIAVIVLDTVINIALTMVFIWQLRPAINSIAHPPPIPAPSIVSVKPRLAISHNISWRKVVTSVKKTSSRDNLRAMLVRNVVGSSLLLLNTIANNAIFLTWSFAKMSHACLLMCLTDVVLGMLVTNWLTIRSAEGEAVLMGPSSVTPFTSNSDTSGLVSLHSRRPTLDSIGRNTELDK
ncbi:hypothetical protein BKA66DRAFT_434381 [Pyrenochaeta sp. MPI-SDFR-AT-0127]|nr:hypothetical protein BKA66DRAFT_434381 [Pyrenochaeta sp. MPI-SDFR-AT-0127]